MAEKTKKKVVKKTKTTPKSKTTKKVVDAKTKKATTTKKAATKTEAVKKTTKKVEKTKKHPSENTKKVNKQTSHKTLAIVTGIIMIILALIYFSMTSTSMKSIFSEDSVFIEHNSNTVIIIEDSTCELCQVDSFVEGVKSQIDPTAQIIRLEYSDKLAQKFISENSIKQTPIVIFSKSFEKSKMWEQISPVFNTIKYNEVDFYMLSFNSPQIKKTLEEPQTNDLSIVNGNLDSANTIYEFCSYEVALCALVNGNELYLEEVKQYTPEYVALYPGALTDAKVITLHLPQEENLDAYVAAFCANEQNKYNEFKLALLDNQFEWVPIQDRNTLFSNYAQQLGISLNEFNTCLVEKRDQYIEQVKFETLIAKDYSIEQTPSFIVNNYLIQGPLDFVSYQSIINS